MQMVNRKSQHILAGFSSEEASAKWIETEKKTWSGKGLDMKNAFLNGGNIRPDPCLYELER